MPKESTERRMDDFERGLQEHYIFLLSYAKSLTRDPVYAEDLVQETILKALTNRHQFTPGTNLGGWLSTILKYHLRSSLRMAKTAQAYVEMKTALSGEGVGPGQEDAMEQLEVAERMQDLPIEQQEALRLVGAEGHTYEDAAALTGISLGTVKSRVSRGRSRLKDKFHVERAPHPARFTKRPRKDGSVLTLYGERFTLAEERRTIEPDLRESRVKIFRCT